MYSFLFIVITASFSVLLAAGSADLSPPILVDTVISHNESSGDGKQSRQFWWTRPNRIYPAVFYPGRHPSKSWSLQSLQSKFKEFPRPENISVVDEPESRRFGLGGTNTFNRTLFIPICGSVVFANGTRWQTANENLTSTSCNLTIRHNGIIQTTPVAQIRLDFLSFSIAQPDATSLCLTDRFDFFGADTVSNTICGDNNGQHMYLEVSPTEKKDIFLVFRFGRKSLSRSWDIKITMLPAGASYLAPSGCLQYFYGTSVGQVTTFNYKDVASPTATRQLANQDYSTCFRNEIINTTLGLRRANRICYYPCYPENSNHTFLISGSSGNHSLLTGTTSCPVDYVILPSIYAYGTTSPAYDRLCGSNPNIINVGLPATTYCSTVSSFRAYYKTDENENGDDKNLGFCFGYYQTFIN